MDVRFKLNSKQYQARKALLSGVRILGYGGARGGGKSFFGRQWMVERRMKYPKTRGIILRRTFDDLQKNHVDRFMVEYPKEIWANTNRPYDNKLHRFTLCNGSIIDLVYCESMVDLEHIQGQEFMDLFMDEAQQHEYEVFSRIMGSQRVSGDVAKEAIPQSLIAFNPGGIGHNWLKAKFINKNDGDTRGIEFIKATVYDNMDNLDAGYIETLQNLPEILRKMWLEGDWNAVSGQFFTHYGPHNLESPFSIPHDGGDRLIASLDHGIAHNTVFILAYIDKDLCVHIVDTYSENGGDTETHAINILDAIESCRWTRGLPPVYVYYDYAMDTKKKINDHTWVSDIDEYKRCFSLSPIGQSCIFMPANKRKVDGCHIMHSMMQCNNGKPKMFIFSQGNQKLVDGISRVIVDDKNPEVYKKSNGDDEADALRYLLVAASGKIAIEEEYARTSAKNNYMYDSYTPEVFSTTVDISGGL